MRWVPNFSAAEIRCARIDGASALEPVSTASLNSAYRRLGPVGAPTTMPDALRRWLRAWSVRYGLRADRLEGFLDSHERGVAATLDAARHDPYTRDLLAPEVLLVFAALDYDPDRLRDCWPRDRDPGEVLALADVFGRPYA